MNSLGQKVKKLRKEKRLTQQDLADNNISRSMLSLIENDVAQASMSTLSYVAQKLGKPLSYFLSDDEEINQKGEQLLTEAEELMHRAQYQEAFEKIQLFISQFKDMGSLLSSMNRLFGSLYTLLGICCFYMESPSSSDYLSQAIEKLSQAGAPHYLSRAYNYLALLKFRENDYEQMEKLLLCADSFLGDTTLNNVQMRLNNSYNLALSYYRQEKFQETLEFIDRTLNYCTKYQLFFNYGDFNMLAALSYKNINKIEQALECNFNALRYYELSHNALMLHAIYVNLCILYRIIGDSYNALYYIDKAMSYFVSTENMDMYNKAMVEKILTLFVFHADAAVLRELISVTIHYPQLPKLEKGELLSVLGTLALREKSHEEAFELLLSAQEHVADHINTTTNIFIYRGLHEIYEYRQDQPNSMLYKQKIEALLEQKPYYR
jgi:transcriptional regulator with XRE-family HTH domain